MPDPDLASRLRREVGAFRERERRRTRFAPVLHVGVVAGERVSGRLPPLGTLDHALRVEVLAALLEGAPTGTEGLWVTRPGPPVVLAEERGWASAAMVAFGLLGHDPAQVCHAVTRHGWVDLRSGESRVWRRLRL